MNTPLSANAADYYDGFTTFFTSSPSADSSGNLYVKVGDTVSFTRSFSKEVGIGQSKWEYSPFILNCDTANGDPTLTCKVIAKGDGDIKYSVEVMTDWTPEKSTYQTFTADNVIHIHATDGSGTSNNISSTPSAADADHFRQVSVGKPDLTISISKARIVNRTVKGVTKKQYKIGVTVYNESPGDANGSIYYKLNDKTPVLVSKTGIKAGKNKQVFLYVDLIEKGKQYTFTADPGNTVDELNETNNTATRVVGK
jgi:hypothetical protein